jgi:hypothetical protein
MDIKQPKNIFQKIEGLLFELAGQPLPENSNINNLPSGSTSGATSGTTGQLNYDNVILSGSTIPLTPDPQAQPQQPTQDVNASKTLGSLVDLSQDGEYEIDIEVSGGAITAITVSSATEKQIQLSEQKLSIETRLKEDFKKTLEDLKTEFQTKLDEFGKTAPEKGIKQTPVNLSEDIMTIAQKRLQEARQRAGKQI